jgi:hypothetical protein
VLTSLTMHGHRNLKVNISLSLYNVYNSLLYFILHSPLSFVDPKIALKIFRHILIISHVSEPYASTGLIKVIHTFILFFMEKMET